jgi:hypothetical protein
VIFFIVVYAEVDGLIATCSISNTDSLGFLTLTNMSVIVR